MTAGARRARAVLALALMGALVAPHAQASRLVVSSANSSSILRYNGQTGAFTDTFVGTGNGGMNFPEGMAVGPDGSLYVRSAGNILRIDGTTGVVTTFAS